MAGFRYTWRCLWIITGRHLGRECSSFQFIANFVFFMLVAAPGSVFICQSSHYGKFNRIRDSFCTIGVLGYLLSVIHDLIFVKYLLSMRFGFWKEIIIFFIPLWNPNPKCKYDTVKLCYLGKKLYQWMSKFCWGHLYVAWDYMTN